MTGVDQDLMRIYGTEKSASLGAYSRLALGVLNAGMERQRQNEDAGRRAAAEEMNEQFRQLEIQQMRGATRQVPMYLSDEGMVRTASAIGRDMARKTAALFPGFKWKGQAALGAAALGSATLGGHLIKKTRGALESPQGPAVYGGGPQGFQPAYGVNQYGTPQVGTSL